MNWLHPLIEKIHACNAFPVEQRATLVLCANELAALCDQVRPTAPMPEVVAVMGRLMLQWGDEQRRLMFGVQRHGEPALCLLDKGIQHRINQPPHDELRRAVVAFFEATHA